ARRRPNLPIPATQLPHIFEPFYRADQARTPGGSHSGLGLRIARGLVEAHGGTLTLQSTWVRARGRSSPCSKQ
ncbi:MAG TPA: sensor histidine kinase, partial [Armatimonadota bacterium]